MKTADLIARLPENIVNHVRDLGKQYNSADCNVKYHYLAKMKEYTNGLRDAGLLTERESSRMFLYGTCIHEGE